MKWLCTILKKQGGMDKHAQWQESFCMTKITSHFPPITYILHPSPVTSSLPHCLSGSPWVICSHYADFVRYVHALKTVAAGNVGRASRLLSPKQDSNFQIC